MLARRGGSLAGGAKPYALILGRRLLMSVALLLAVSALSFVLLSFVPGSAADAVVGTTGDQAQIHAVEHQLGLDKPVYVQYARWLGGAVHGDFGTSLIGSESVTERIGTRLSVSLSLIVGALLVTLLVGVAFGIFSAVRGGVASRLVDGLSLLGLALPTFWVGAVLVELFAVHLQWLPAVGYVKPSESPERWIESLVLPVAALALGGLATVAKNTREAMLDVLASEHVRMAWANGVPARSIFFVYALRNAAIRITTVVGLVAVGLLGGTVLVETVFAVPGMGSLLVSSVGSHDTPVVQGLAVVFTLIVVVVNLIVDLVCSWLDPRVRIR